MENDAMAPVVLAAYRHELEADLLVNFLRSAGIDARSSGAMVSGGRVEIPVDVEVVVPAGELASAKECMADLASDREIDWDAVDVGSARASSLSEASYGNRIDFDVMMRIAAIVLGGVLVLAAIAFAISTF